MKIGIIGGGLTGLTIGYRLSQGNHDITIFEKENKLGGLAASFKNQHWSWPLEDFFHHFFTNDLAVRELIKDLDLTSKLFYSQSKASIFKNGQIHQFDSPLSILNSSLFSPKQKAQIGLATAYLKTTNDWQKLEKTTAQTWLKRNYGLETYRLLWKPLLNGKFGPFAKEISMAWFWARIKKRTLKLGYIESGFQVLVDRLAEKIKENGNQIKLNFEITADRQLIDDEKFDRIIFTTPSASFFKIMRKKLPSGYQKKISQLKMVGAINLIITSKKKFLTDNTYWLNVNEPGFPFVAVVQHTNFINPKHYDNHHIFYVGGYYPQNHRYFKMKKAAILKEFLPYLNKINPDFKRLSVIDCQLSTNLYAQPVVPINYSKLIPQIKTPVKNVYLANMQMIYPWDRGVNYAIKMGAQVADEINKSY